MTRQTASVLSALLLTMLAGCEVAIEAVEESFALGDPVVQARRCANCGWIESKREIVPAVVERHAVRSYEYTVRMSDGSSSVFQQALPATWRLRERLTVD
jgi:hypothetical protein